MSKENHTENHEKLYQIIRRAGQLLFVALLLLVFAYGANNRLEVTEFDYQSEQIPLSFNGYRIVQLSDLHNKVFSENNAPLLRALAQIRPDMILLTGDMIDGSNHTDVDAALLLMQQMPAIAPTYYVYGNHEHMLDTAVLDQFQETIASYGVTFLNNENVQISSAAGQTFTLIGMDDYSLQANILATQVEEAKDEFCVMMAHEPQLLEEFYAPTGVDVVFSGHAHGGQFRIPLLDQGILAPDQGFLPRMTGGVYQAEQTTMYLSRGLGNSVFPLRLFNHPEVVVVTLHSDET